MVNYTIQRGDILLCDITATKSIGEIGSVLTLQPYNSYSGGLCFNFNKEADVQKQLDKTVYIIRKPGVPIGYEIGLGERIWNITSTFKTTYGGGNDTKYAAGNFYSMIDLNFLCNFQFNRNTPTGYPSYGILQLYYIGDGYNSGFEPVVVKSLWYEQRSGRGSLIDVRISLTQVTAPGT